MIIRDDDLPQNVPIDRLDAIHQMFIEHDQIHTMCVLASNLDSRKDFVDYVKSHSHIDIALHGWRHDNYSEMNEEQIIIQLEMCMDVMKRHFGRYPTKWYLPWNGWSKEYFEKFGNGFYGVSKVKGVARRYGLSIDHVAEHVKHYLDGKSASVVYFHAWDDRDIPYIKQLLETL